MYDDDFKHKPGDNREQESSVSPLPIPEKLSLARRLLALSQVGTALMSEQDEARLFHLIARTACDLTGATFAAFLLRQDDDKGALLILSDGQFFQLAAVVGVTTEQEAFFQQMTIGGEGLLSPIFQQGVPVLVADALAHLVTLTSEPASPQTKISAREAARAYAQGKLPSSALPSFGVPAGHPLVRSFLGAPLLNQAGEVLGALLLGHSEPDRLNGEDQTLLVSLASQAIVALEHARLNRVAQQRTKQLEAIFEAMTDAVFVFDQDGNVTMTNKTARQLLALLSPTDYATRPLFERYTYIKLADEQGQPLQPAEWPTLRVLAGEVLTPERAAETTVPTREGFKLYTQVTGGPLHDRDGIQRGGVVIVHNITERKRMEREREQRERERREDIEAQRELLLMILDELPSSVCLVRGEDARLMLANRTNTLLWGTPWPYNETMQDFLAEHSIRLAGPTGQPLPPEQWATLRALRQGETVRQHQETIHRPDGSTLPVLVNAVSLGTTSRLSRLPSLFAGAAPDHSEPLALVIHQDVTVIKESESLKDEFIAIAAHELRNPVAALSGFAQTLVSYTNRGKGPQLSEFQNEVIGEIELASARLITLTEQLLDVSRLQAGRLQLRPALTDLVALGRGAVIRFQRTTERCTISLHTSAPQIHVMVDPVRIDQILANLLGNAIKYSLEGGSIDVRIEVHRQQQQILISVRDEGLGIPKQEQAKIFSRFNRASNAQQAGLLGTGLGLYLCRELLALHGGHIWFESREGKGSMFFVALPLNAALP